MSIKKAVLPVAGFGTRFLPATKAIPKEMLPIIDKPLIEYAVEEAVDAGIEEIIFVTSHTKIAIENHFDSNFELEEKLLISGKNDVISLINPEQFKNIRFFRNELHSAMGNLNGVDKTNPDKAKFDPEPRTSTNPAGGVGHI